MAGIGLDLNRLVKRGGYLSASQAYLSSAVIAAGPWMTSVTALAALDWASRGFLPPSSRALLFVTITYAFGASLVITGALQMVVTRYLADRLYAEDEAAVTPAAKGILLTAFPLLVLVIPFAVWGPLDLPYRLAAVNLVIVLCLVWLLTTFLSATRDYMRLVLVFVSSYGVSLLAAIALGRQYGLTGGLLGFNLGQVICAVLLGMHVQHEFPSSAGFSLAFVSYIRKFWDLALLGLVYAAAIWADNVMLWFSPSGLTTAGFFRVFPAYDTGKLAAYLLTVPAAAVFLAHLETNFYKHYRDFFVTCMKSGSSLARYREARDGMRSAVRDGLSTILKLQGFVALFALIMAPELARLLGIPAAHVGMLRWEIVGASFQFVLLVAILLLLYLEVRAATLGVVLLFGAANVGLTLTTVMLGPAFYGIGYAGAALLSAGLGLIVLNRHLRRLDYLTFMGQRMKVGAHEEAA
jgi:uncharacterized membrane protein